MDTTADTRTASTSAQDLASGRDRIVVAVADVASCDAALRWSCVEAARDRLPLQLLHVVPVELPPSPLRDPDPAVQAAARDRADRELELAAAGLPQPVELLPPLAVSGPPTTGLLGAVDAHVRLLVIGHRDRTAVQRLLSGSTSVATAGRSPVRVAVVPDGWRPTSSGDVVVGVPLHPTAGHYESDEEVLREAFVRARATRLRLVAVTAWNVPPILTWSATDIERLRGEVLASLDTVLQPWRDEYPDVEVQRHAVAERPVDAVTEAAQTAEIVVVGRHTRARRHGGFRWGSTCRGVLHHTRVPVLVVPLAHDEPHQESPGESATADDDASAWDPMS